MEKVIISEEDNSLNTITILDPCDNILYAKYRANKLKVIVIFDINDPFNIKSSYINYFKKNITHYIINEIVVPDSFDKDKDIICSGGIHYYKTIDVAYFHGKIPTGYTGFWAMSNINDQIIINKNNYADYYCKDYKMPYWINHIIK